MQNPYYQPYWNSESTELEHFGIKGMKWGIRRYQNPDGTLTEAGKSRYGDKVERLREKEHRLKDHETETNLKWLNRAIEKHPDTKFFKAEKNQLTKFVDEETKAINSMTDKQLLDRSRGRKIGYTAAGLLEAGSVASFVGTLAAVPLLGPAGIAVSGALGTAWVSSFLGGALVYGATANKYGSNRSEYAKNVKKGQQWLGGATLKYGSGQIATAEKLARKTGMKNIRVSHYTPTGPNSGHWSTLTVPISLIDKYADM